MQSVLLYISIAPGPVAALNAPRAIENRAELLRQDACAIDYDEVLAASADRRHAALA